MHVDPSFERLRFRVARVPEDHPGFALPLSAFLPARGGYAWFGERRQMVSVGAGEALTLRGGASAFDRVWARVSCAQQGDSDASEDAPSPIAFASFAFFPEDPSVIFVPSLALIDEAGARWVISAGAGDVPCPLEELEGACAIAAPEVIPPAHVRFEVGSMTRSQWRDAVGRVASYLRQGQADKAVLARDMLIRSSSGFDERFLLERLGQLYPHTWRFAVSDLVGASPEMLIASHEGRAYSRVLAGSQTPDRGAELLESAKDLREHALATASVSDVVRAQCEQVSENGPFLLELPNVAHLATDVRARMGGASLLSLVAALHPTAAVCGTPRTQAMELIRRVEETPRGRYSGPVGWVDMRGDGEFALALRCGLVEEDGMRLFAGAGIMPDSDPQSELAETEAKMRPLLDALGSTGWNES